MHSGERCGPWASGFNLTSLSLRRIILNLYDQRNVFIDGIYYGTVPEGIMNSVVSVSVVVLVL